MRGIRLNWNSSLLALSSSRGSLCTFTAANSSGVGITSKSVWVSSGCSSSGSKSITNFSICSALSRSLPMMIMIFCVRWASRQDTNCALFCFLAAFSFASLSAASFSAVVASLVPNSSASLPSSSSGNLGSTIWCHTVPGTTCEFFNFDQKRPFNFTPAGAVSLGLGFMPSGGSSTTGAAGPDAFFFVPVVVEAAFLAAKNLSISASANPSAVIFCRTAPSGSIFSIFSYLANLIASAGESVGGFGAPAPAAIAPFIGGPLVKKESISASLKPSTVIF
mmetsp:Transcript_7307/g.12308  ORF Transcript_7307/g.12308 Transcript_7307/m.12308 type:complete len:278 (-) Transcript_7307:375-1208(-)